MAAIMPRAMAAALVAAMLALTATAAPGAEAPSADDTARFLAGMPPAPGSPLAALAERPAWRQHARYFGTVFDREEHTSLAKIRAFSQTQLTDKHDTMLYMFSGPDFLYATSFFPGASTYVLSGLEPVGEVPQLTGLTRPALDWTLRNIESSLSSLLSFSFFITKNMKAQLHGGPVYGTLPILYVFLARTGKTIHDVRFVSLDADGNIMEPEAAPAEAAGKKSAKRAASGAKGVKIVFSDGDRPTQTLYYFSTNLADDGVKRSGFLAFCAKLGAADSLIKSASYLLHSGGFATVRSFLLDHSATILQDDSGIPLAYFDPKIWRLQPYGRYVGPLAIFGRSYQPRLGELFRKGNAIPIDFGVGYRWRRNESNLLLARKRAEPTGETALNPVLTNGSASGAVRGAVTEHHRKRKKHDRRAANGGCWWPSAGVFSFCSSSPSEARWDRPPK